jgi:hypothetical protein
MIEWQQNFGWPCARLCGFLGTEIGEGLHFNSILPKITRCHLNLRREAQTRETGNSVSIRSKRHMALAGFVGEEHLVRIRAPVKRDGASNFSNK